MGRLTTSTRGRTAGMRANERAEDHSMRLVIERGELLRALGHVTSVVERRTTIPILSNVLLKACASRRSSSRRPISSARSSRSVAADVSQPGAVTVPAHMLHDIVRKLPDGARSTSSATPRRSA